MTSKAGDMRKDVKDAMWIDDPVRYDPVRQPRSGGILLAVGVSPRDVAPRWIPLQALKGRHPAPVPCRRCAAFVQDLFLGFRGLTPTARGIPPLRGFTRSLQHNLTHGNETRNERQ